MDGQQFDRLTQQFGHALTRRRFGALLAVPGLTLGVAGAEPIQQTAAKHKHKHKKPKKTCKHGAVKCGSACVNTKTNAAHCGGCGRACGAGQSCVDGSCQGGCAGDLVLCGNDCVDLDDDEAHCGRCDRVCTGDLTCLSGACGCADGTACGDECVDTQTDDDHCGGCGNPCGGGTSCQGGQCVPPTCGANQILCGGTCVDSVGGNPCCSQADCGGCQKCPANRMCCNDGDGTAPRCKEPNGSFCPPPGVG